MTKNFDVAIIGSGPSGSSAANSLARKGYSVLLVDKAIFPREKLCGDFLNPINWALFERLGISDDLLKIQHEKIEAFRLTAHSGEEMTFRFPTGHGQRRGFGLGLRRSELDGLLLRRAESEGATVMQGWTGRSLDRVKGGWAIGLSSHSGRKTLHSSFLIGADGRNSWVAYCLGLTQPVAAGQGHIGFQLHLRNVKDLGRQVQIHLFPGGYAGLVSVGEGTANLCFTVGRDVLRGERSCGRIVQKRLLGNPYLGKALENCEFLGRSRSAYPVFFPPRRSFGHRFLLAGDSAQVTEPVTGEGIFFALTSGALAAEIAHGGFTKGDLTEKYLARYQKACGRHLALRRQFNRVLRSLIHRPSLIRAFIRLSARTSFPIGPMVNLVTRRSRPMDPVR